ncbi:MAG: DUF547 domain-containing protein [Gammaproteobacteria bacterium]|nr:DUF547 domain-containing protein [Gammaproteobacteria bacterium]MDH3447968.1 DUF547 domain-containing protein [Gammaproteobacteria bacterium]
MSSFPRPASLLLAVILLAWMPGPFAAPAAKLWERWAAHVPGATLEIDHRRWNDWLERFVSTAADGINRVDYGGVDTAGRKRLRAYLDDLASIAISHYGREQQRAYWINLYNALTIDVVLEYYPVNSIRDISSGIFAAGPWGRKLVTIEGQALTLDDIEHRILRPIWQDPRIHYAVNCASLGCPNLLDQAFTAANTESLLDQAAREFVNHSRGAQVVDGRLRVSSIYHWFESDFGGNDAGVIAHLKLYAEAGLADALASVARVDEHEYDWRINDLGRK